MMSLIAGRGKSMKILVVKMPGFIGKFLKIVLGII